MAEQTEENGDKQTNSSNAERRGDDGRTMESLLQEGYPLDAPRKGEIRVGTIAKITDTDVLVDVGAKSEGVIPIQELERLSEDQRAELQIGGEVTVYIVRSRGSDGTIDLSLVRAEEEKDWRNAQNLLETQQVFEGVVSGYNKGGLIVKMGRLRGFLPASQVSLSRRRRAHGDTPEKRWGKMVGEHVISKIIEVDRGRNRLILSERAAAREARDILKERLISELEPGEVRTGHVISLADFGAFIDIGGADGLVHTSEISWKRIAHPREVLRVGQKVKVKVLSLDPKKKRISLSIRELEEDPWQSLLDPFQEGQLLMGRITKLTKFGAFASVVKTEDFEIEGLIHISELSDRRIEHPKEIVQEGQELTLRIISIDRERRRIGLSLKKVDSAEYAELDWQTAMQDLAALEESEATGETQAPSEGLEESAITQPAEQAEPTKAASQAEEESRATAEEQKEGENQSLEGELPQEGFETGPGESEVAQESEIRGAEALPSQSEPAQIEDETEAEAMNVEADKLAGEEPAD